VRFLRALGALYALARPMFLGGGVVGFALGALLAWRDGYRIDLAAYAWGQATVLAFHLMVHYANEYYDQATDAIVVRTPLSGGSGVLVRGEVPPRFALTAARTCAFVGSALVIHAAFTGAWVVAGLACLAGVLGWAYSAPPIRLVSRGLGECTTAIVVGALVPAVGYASVTGTLVPQVFVVAFPLVLAIIPMMLSVELPDCEADATCGKRTLVVRWGHAVATSVIQYGAIFTAGAMTLVVCGLLGYGMPTLGVLLINALAALGVIFAAPAVLPYAGVALNAVVMVSLPVVVVLAHGGAP
jgi:1,4-dihydroxy-2-naphthoate polyprenyltransferase